MNDSDSNSEKYELLYNEILNNISKNEKLYTKLISDDNSIDYEILNELKNYNITIDYDNIKDFNSNMWAYFKKKYNEQTRLKQTYFTLKQKLQDKLNIINTQHNELKTSLNTIENENQVAISTIKDDKYQLQKLEYHNTIIYYTIITLFIIFIINILNLITLQNNKLTLIIILLLIFGLLTYIIYKIYLHKTNRNNTVWDLNNYSTIDTKDNSKKTNIITPMKGEHKNKENIHQEILNIIHKQT